MTQNGNTLSDGRGKSYTWDFENRLVQAIVPGTKGGTTSYLYDGYSVLEELDNSGNFLDGWPTQARFWLEWGRMFIRHRLGPTIKLDCPHALGTDTFPPQRAESFRGRRSFSTRLVSSLRDLVLIFGGLPRTYPSASLRAGWAIVCRPFGAGVGRCARLRSGRLICPCHPE
jgi:hypothetical protein